MNINRTLLAIFVIVLFGVGCKKKSSKVTPTCDGSSPTYTNFVAGLISSQCASCHDYSTYTKLSSVLSNGKFRSEVLENQTMPKDGNLSESDLNKLQCWVENNYPEN